MLTLAFILANMPIFFLDRSKKRKTSPERSSQHFAGLRLFNIFGRILVSSNFAC